jgi:hypothetical protein
MIDPATYEPNFRPMDGDLDLTKLPVPTNQGIDAYEWWSKYTHEMRRIYGRKWLDILDRLPPDESQKLGQAIIKCHQLATLAYMARGRKKRPKKKGDPGHG